MYPCSVESDVISEATTLISNEIVYSLQLFFLNLPHNPIRGKSKREWIVQICKAETKLHFKHCNAKSYPWEFRGCIDRVLQPRNMWGIDRQYPDSLTLKNWILFFSQTQGRTVGWFARTPLLLLADMLFSRNVYAWLIGVCSIGFASITEGRWVAYDWTIGLVSVKNIAHICTRAPIIVHPKKCSIGSQTSDHNGSNTCFTLSKSHPVVILDYGTEVGGNAILWLSGQEALSFTSYGCITEEIFARTCSFNSNSSRKLVGW